MTCTRLSGCIDTLPKCIERLLSLCKKRLRTINDSIGRVASVCHRETVLNDSADSGAERFFDSAGGYQAKISDSLLRIDKASKDVTDEGIVGLSAEVREMRGIVVGTAATVKRMYLGSVHD